MEQIDRTWMKGTSKWLNPLESLEFEFWKRQLQYGFHGCTQANPLKDASVMKICTGRRHR